MKGDTVSQTPCCEHEGGMHLENDRAGLFTCFAVVKEHHNATEDIDVCGCVTDESGRRLTEDEYEDRMAKGETTSPTLRETE